MGAGGRGTFVISWSQTEVDGLRAGPPNLLIPGAAWRWTGQPVRVDGPQGILQLDGAEGAAEMRRRAARTVRRLIGVAVAEARPAACDDGYCETPDQSFVVTDGQQGHTVTILDVCETGARLLLFVGEMPPADRDLWVVRSAIGQSPAADAARVPGGVICFAPGTRLLTPQGPRPVEALRPGDLVDTKDNGAQEVLWCGHRQMTGARLYAMPHLRPIRIRAAAFGAGRPDADLIVSPQHRMLVKGAAAQALFNTPEVLVTAQDMINDLSVVRDHHLRCVTYVHVLLPRHQIVWANGLETESFHPSGTALDMVDPDQRAALLAVLPGIDADPSAYGDPVRRNLSPSEAAILRYDLAA